MQYSASSIHYLHIAYAAMILANLGYVAWLYIRYTRTRSGR